MAKSIPVVSEATIAKVNKTANKLFSKYPIATQQALRIAGELHEGTLIARDEGDKTRQFELWHFNFEGFATLTVCSPRGSDLAPDRARFDASVEGMEKELDAYRARLVEAGIKPLW